ITSPVLMSFAALSTVCGFMWLAAPRSSPAPHLDGQRALSAGGSQDGVWAMAEPVSSRVASMVPSIEGFMVVLPELRLELERDRCWIGILSGTSTLPLTMAANHLLFRLYTGQPADLGPPPASAALGCWEKLGPVLALQTGKN